MKVELVRDLLDANNRIADEIRGILSENGVRSINIMGSPGCGKTTLIEAALEQLGGSLPVGIIEGDITTSVDAERLSRFDIPVVQINTQSFGGDCHLGSHTVRAALEKIDLESIDLLIVENIGNLVCPAEFDIGEKKKVVVLSVTEGEDKPLKYPLMFQKSDLLILSKTDLTEACGVNPETFITNARATNPNLDTISLSCRTGDGIEAWTDWIKSL
jgi:hydrogenase nickel incorporation protein HypB